MAKSVTMDDVWSAAEVDDVPAGWVPGKQVKNGMNVVRLERPDHIEIQNGKPVIYWLAEGPGYLTMVARAAGWEVVKE